MLRWLSSNYWVRLLLLTLLIGTIPVVALGSLSFMRAKDSVQQKTNDSNMQLLQQTRMNVEQVLQLFENLTTQYISTSTVNEALKIPFTSSGFMLMNELAAGLNKMQPYELGIQNVYLANLEHQWVLSNQGFEMLDNSPMKSLINEYAKSDQKSFWKTIDPKAAAGTPKTEGVPQGAAGVHLVKKLPLNRTLGTGLIIGEISASKLEKLVYNEAGERETIIFDDAFRLLTQPAGSVLKSADELEFVANTIRSLPDAPRGYFTFEVNKETFAVNYTKSDYNGWYYLSLASLNDITKDSRSIGWYTFYISAGTFVFILLMAWVGSRRMYMPIRRVFSAAVGEDFPDGRPHKDELQVIGEQIHLLRKSQTHMKDQLRIHSKQLESFFIRRLLQREIRPSETRERWVQFGYDPRPSMFGVLTVQIDTLEGTRYGEQDVDLLMFAINNMASELIPPKSRLEPVVMADSQVTICRGDDLEPPAFEAQLYEYAGKVQSYADDLLGLKVSVGISGIYRDVDETHQAYKESLESLKYRVRFGGQVILPYTNVLPASPIAAPYPDWLEKELVDAIKMENAERAKEVLGEFIRKAIADYPRYYDFQMALTRLLIDLLREWQEAGESANPLQTDGKPVHEQLLELRTAEEIEQWLYGKVVKPMIESLRHKWDSQNKKISERMLEMIHEEFTSELTLELCATRLHYHPNYIKTVFRKETGSSFSEYLSQYRLSVAKQWLVETNMKISEIAEKLQYQNSQNFIRYFRKMENMTPGQYREKHE